eukprot:1792195-Prymnesium_polylepis.1
MSHCHWPDHFCLARRNGTRRQRSACATPPFEACAPPRTGGLGALFRERPESAGTPLRGRDSVPRARW